MGGLCLRATNTRVVNSNLGASLALRLDSSTRQLSKPNAKALQQGAHAKIRTRLQGNTLSNTSISVSPAASTAIVLGSGNRLHSPGRRHLAPISRPEGSLDVLLPKVYLGASGVSRDDSSRQSSLYWFTRQRRQRPSRAVLDEARLALRASKIDASNLRVTGVPSSSGHPTQTNNSPSHARPLPLHQRVHCSQPLRSGCHVEVVESAIA